MLTASFYLMSVNCVIKKKYIGKWFFTKSNLEKKKLSSLECYKKNK